MEQLRLDIRTEAVAGEMLSDEDDDGTPLAQIQSRINESSTPRLFKEISEVDVELADPSTPKLETFILQTKQSGYREEPGSLVGNCE
jgi:hypothetical protein